MNLGIAPVRISFAGGGTDFPNYFEKFGGSVITTSISKYVYVMIKTRNDNSFQALSFDFQTYQKSTSYENLKPKIGTEIAVSVFKFLNFKKGTDLSIFSDVPPGSGLGSSGALAVNLVNIIKNLKQEPVTKNELAEIAYHIGKNILKWPIGKQDEYASAFGGFNCIRFTKDKTKIIPIKMSKNSLSELQKNLLLFFVGETRNSSSILSKHIAQIEQNQQQILKSLYRTHELAESMYDSLKKSDLTSFGELLHKGWLTKKKFVTNVSNERIDRIYDSAIKSGAQGGKLTGAGGGGHILFYCEKSKQSKLVEKMEKYGLKKIDFGFDRKGAKVLSLYDFKQV